MELIQYIRILRKRWWLVFLCVLLGTSAAYAYTQQIPPIYRSTAVLLLSPGLSPNLLVADSRQIERVNQMAQNYSYYLRARPFAERVIELEALPISAGQLIRSISTRIVGGTEFFEITAIASTPQQAQHLAQAVANNFLAEVNMLQQQVTSRRTVSVDGDREQVLLEKLEREREYYEERVAALRVQLAEDPTQPLVFDPTALGDDLQTLLSESEARLIETISNLIALRPNTEVNQVDTVVIVQPADLPTAPANDDWLQFLLAAFSASLVLGVALTIGWEYLDPSIKRPEELERLIDQAPLAVIGRIKKKNPGLVTLTQPSSPATEAFRDLRTGLQFNSIQPQPKSLVITSVRSGEGKTTVAVNLAVSLAQSGRSVLLVDANLRDPQIHEYMGLPNPHGLGDLLQAREQATKPVDIQDYLQKGPVEGLTVLPSGPIPARPAELLGSDSAAKLIAELAELADVVIYDSPPALAVTDAVILSGRIGTTLLVLRAGTTNRDLFRRCAMDLQQAGAKLLPPVLNHVHPLDMDVQLGYGPKHLRQKFAQSNTSNSAK